MKMALGIWRWAVGGVRMANYELRILNPALCLRASVREEFIMLAVGLMLAGTWGARAAAPSSVAEDPAWSRIEATVAQLQLSDAQKAVVAETMEKCREDSLRWTLALGRARAVWLRAVYANAPEEEAVRAASREMARCEEELSVLRARMLAGLRRVLTPAQGKLLDRAREELLQAAERQARDRAAQYEAWIKAYGKDIPRPVPGS